MRTEYSRDPTRYILSRTLLRKNGRRRMLGRFHTQQACIDYAVQHYQPNYKYTIYTYDWRFVKDIDILNLLKKGENNETVNDSVHG